MPKKIACLMVFLAFFGLQASSSAFQPQARHVPSGQYSASIRSILCYCASGSADTGTPCTEVLIQGTGFGAPRETHFGNVRKTRVVVIDGQAMTDPNEYYGWADDHIACDIDDFVPIVVNRVYKFAIGEITYPPQKPLSQDLAIISPVFNFRYLIKWRTDWPPKSGHPGEVITEMACGVRPPHGDEVLMIGSTQVGNLISWGNPWGYVIFEVPNMAQGTYDLYIKQGMNIVSTKKKFTLN